MNQLYTGSDFSLHDHVIINSVRLNLDDLINQDYMNQKTVRKLHETFANNKPFPHLVFEGLFSPTLLELVNSEFDSLKWGDWQSYDTSNERKFGSRPNTRFGPATQLYFNTIYSGPFVRLMTGVTGIEGLVPDPELHAGGLHEIPTGGKFAVHTDFNQHPVTHLDNRLVFITYLNKGWEAGFGGALELWCPDEDICKVAVEPVFGRSVLFYQSSRSPHGHPTPVCAPEGRTRRSAAAYFYSNGRSDGETTEFHSTVITKQIKLEGREKVVRNLKYFTPPAVVDAVRKVKGLF